MEATTSLLKRDASSPSNYPAYVLAIIVGCIACVLIGYGIFTMYHGVEEETYRELSQQQRQYMHEVRQRTLDDLEAASRRYTRAHDSPRETPKKMQAV
ncbi:hypothetical protein N7539_002484 [Penicillium diatomitis]|uniref:Transmembrane protein n=1 Tax=Penicillium diatomitis TaxID=2819901 RepID=A0A9X0BZ82_9EURO|nr:uncharacterized protein N7539_002484 [Penicillium diatomitis]KAJ5490917.1 hypothetical protein N7539_002484 [Penicillium diatomitis]